MAVGNVARNAQPQPITLLLSGQTEVRFEHLFQPLLRNPRPFVVDMQHERTIIVIDVQVRVLTVFQSVVDQVADAALERQRFTRIRRQCPPLLSHAAIAVRRQVGLHQTIEHMIEVDLLDIFVDVGVLHALQRALDQQFQLIQIAAELGLQFFVFKQFDPQAQAGDRRTQVMGYRAEQLTAFSQVAADALAHGVEGATDLHHFAAAALGHRLDVSAQ